MGLKLVESFFNKTIQRINSLINRGEVVLVDDNTKIQKMQVMIHEDDVPDGIERYQDYGFTSNPLSGAEALIVFQGGKRGNGVVVKVDDRRYRLKGLQNGEVAIYTDEGDKIHFKRGKKIEVTTSELTINSSSKVTVNTEEAYVNAAKVSVTSPEVLVTSSTKIDMVTPLLSVSGVISCGGLAAGGAVPSSGKVLVQGDLETTGKVKDSVGTMAQMRSTYNGHNHPISGSGTETTTPNQGM